MKTRADLFRECARVIEMCEGTDVNPNTCVKHNDIIGSADSYWTFRDDPNSYDFALCLIDGVPVFKRENPTKSHIIKLDVDGVGGTVTLAPGENYLYELGAVTIMVQVKK